jgi:hypothetical protein
MMGLILAVIGTQMVIEGLHGAFRLAGANGRHKPKVPRGQGVEVSREQIKG